MQFPLQSILSRLLNTASIIYKDRVLMVRITSYQVFTHDFPDPSGPTTNTEFPSPFIIVCITRLCIVLDPEMYRLEVQHRKKKY